MEKNQSASSANKKNKISETEELNKKCEEYLNGWKRERADFLNYKKEEMERIGQLVKYANEEIILKLLPILDNFYLAEKHISKNEESSGFLQIRKQLEDLLLKEGIEPIEVIGKEFDPTTMDAVEEVCVKSDLTHTQEDSRGPTSGESGTVVEEVQRGYKMHGKLIRPARVKVSK